MSTQRLRVIIYWLLFSFAALQRVVGHRRRDRHDRGGWLVHAQVLARRHTVHNLHHSRADPFGRHWRHTADVRRAAVGKARISVAVVGGGRFWDPDLDHLRDRTHPRVHLRTDDLRRLRPAPTRPSLRTVGNSAVAAAKTAPDGAPDRDKKRRPLSFIVSVCRQPVTTDQSAADTRPHPIIPVAPSPAPSICSSVTWCSRCPLFLPPPTSASIAWNNRSGV